MNKHILVTGGNGFIGSHLVRALVNGGDRVTVLDSAHAPIDVAHRVIEGDIWDADLSDLGRVDVIVHLAALAGVRQSIAEPLHYEHVNVRGTLRLLDFAKCAGVKQFVFASSSSVYGNVTHRSPFREDVDIPTPISPYGATKLAGEHLGRIYSQVHGVRFLALRFFTVYGPRQRGDLAIQKFARKMLSGEPVPLYGDGSTKRDYTYIEDIVRGIRLAIDYRDSMYEAVNLGSGHPVRLSEMVQVLEQALGVKAVIDRQPPQAGDVDLTWADCAKAWRLFGYEPRVSFTKGVARYVEWLRAQAVAA